MKWKYYILVLQSNKNFVNKCICKCLFYQAPKLAEKFCACHLSTGKHCLCLWYQLLSIFGNVRMTGDSIFVKFISSNIVSFKFMIRFHKWFWEYLLSLLNNDFYYRNFNFWQLLKGFKNLKLERFWKRCLMVEKYIEFWIYRKIYLIVLVYSFGNILVNILIAAV